MGGVDAVVWVDPPILVARGLAGRSYQVIIGDRATVLTFPSEGSKSLVPAPPVGPDPVPPRFPRPPLAKATPRGRAELRMGLGVPKGGLAIGALRLRWNDAVVATYEQPYREVADEVGIWLGRVRDWLAGWSRGTREAPAARTPPRLRIVLVNDLDAGNIWRGGIPTTVLRRARIANGEGVRAAFAAASAAIELPLAHALLCDARMHWMAAEYRYAVINACSAAEVALSEAIRTQLRKVGQSPDAVEQVLKGASGIVDLYGLASTSRTLPVSIGQVRGRLAGPRNDAVHNGDLLDSDRAVGAILTSQELVDTTPLPTPKQLLRQAV